MSKHTPGPWRWEMNRQLKSIALVGGRPMFDKTVMDFERWGMGGASPRFNSAITSGEFNIMFRVSDRQDWIADFPGRSHHAHWCANVVHPDARLIAAAPDLLEALQPFVLANSSEEFVTLVVRSSDITKARAAIAKVTGAA